MTPGRRGGGAWEGGSGPRSWSRIEDGRSAPAILVVTCRDPHAYGEDHLAILRPLARQLGGIIGRLRLFRQVVSDSTYVRNLLDSIDSPVYTVDAGRAITRINRAGVAFLRAVSGGGTFEGVNILDLLPASPLKEAIRRAFDRTGSVNGPHFTEEIAIAGPAGGLTTRLTVNTLKDGDRADGIRLQPHATLRRSRRRKANSGTGRTSYSPCMKFPASSATRSTSRPSWGRRSHSSGRPSAPGA